MGLGNRAFGLFSGWFGLQQACEPPWDESIIRLRGQSGSMRQIASFEQIALREKLQEIGQEADRQ